MNIFMNRLSHIPLYLIESFIIISESESLEEAGKKLQLTQSTLSKQMKLLESMLPFPLFTYQGRNKKLTRFGEKIKSLLKPNFSQTQNLISEACLQFQENQDFPIRIAGRGEFLDKILFQFQHPGTVQLMPMDNQAAMLELKKRSIEIAITHEVDESFEYIKKPYIKNKTHLIIPKKLLTQFKLPTDVHLISYNQLSLFLKKAPCLMYKYNDPLFESALKNWEIESKNLNIQLVYPNYRQLMKYLNHHPAWALIPDHIEFDHNQFVRIIPKNVDQYSKTFYICYRKELAQNKFFKEFVRQLMNHS